MLFVKLKTLMVLWRFSRIMMTSQFGLCWCPLARRGTLSGDPRGTATRARDGRQTTRRASCLTHTNVTSPWLSGEERTSRWEILANVTLARLLFCCGRSSLLERARRRTMMMSGSISRTNPRRWGSVISFSLSGVLVVGSGQATECRLKRMNALSRIPTPSS